jgi:hypothetical protein
MKKAYTLLTNSGIIFTLLLLHLLIIFFFFYPKIEGRESAILIYASFMASSFYFFLMVIINLLLLITSVENLANVNKYVTAGFFLIHNLYYLPVIRNFGGSGLSLIVFTIILMFVLLRYNLFEEDVDNE